MLFFPCCFTLEIFTTIKSERFSPMFSPRNFNNSFSFLFGSVKVYGSFKGNFYIGIRKWLVTLYTWMKDPSRYITIISNTNAPNDTVIPVLPWLWQASQSPAECYSMHHTTNIIQNGGATAWMDPWFNACEVSRIHRATQTEVGSWLRRLA